MSARLALTWLIYTVIFVIACLILNATLVPAIADRIANFTSDWQYWKKQDYPLTTCLDILDGQVLYIADHDMSENAMDEVFHEVEEQLNAVYRDGSSRMESLVRVSIASSDVEAMLETKEINDETPLLVSLNGASPEWLNVDTLRFRTILDILKESAPAENWQILDAGDWYESRDLSLYWSIRDLKLPFAFIAYLVGCILIIFIGYSRFSRYFDEMTQAVTSLIQNKEVPIKLSKDLFPVQGELNDIRFASLADERAAKAAETRKDELVAYLAHDIKTPLTSVIGYLMLLDEAPDLPKDIRQKYIHIACQKSERLESLIDEFFEITRYNLHAIPIERRSVDICTLCMQVADEFYPACQEKELEIELDVPVDETAFVDPDKLARVLTNIMRNAIAYADPNTKISLKVTKSEEGHEIAITDHGREISPAHLESIFERFYREDGARSSDSGGSGLGLAIAKEIMEAHKGTISAQSSDGVTTFTIRVP